MRHMVLNNKNERSQCWSTEAPHFVKHNLEEDWKSIVESLSMFHDSYFFQCISFSLACVANTSRANPPYWARQERQTIQYRISNEELVGLMESRFKRDWFLPSVPRAPPWAQTRSGPTMGPDLIGAHPFLQALTKFLTLYFNQRMKYSWKKICRNISLLQIHHFLLKTSTGMKQSQSQSWQHKNHGSRAWCARRVAEAPRAEAEVGVVVPQITRQAAFFGLKELNATSDNETWKWKFLLRKITASPKYLL